MLQGNKNSPYCNSEGYPNPTAYGVIKEENELEKKVCFLVKIVKFIISESGFELVNRIEIKDKKSGRIFRWTGLNARIAKETNFQPVQMKTLLAFIVATRRLSEWKPLMKFQVKMKG